MEKAYVKEERGEVYILRRMSGKWTGLIGDNVTGANCRKKKGQHFIISLFKAREVEVKKIPEGICWQVISMERGKKIGTPEKLKEGSDLIIILGKGYFFGGREYRKERGSNYYLEIY